MRITNTVFVIGAGASKEVNLPTGEELKPIICNLLTRSKNTNSLNLHRDGFGLDIRIEEGINQYLSLDSCAGPSPDEFKRAIRYISEQLPSALSIDNFIEQNRGDKAIEITSKLAIAYAILDHESRCKLSLERYAENPHIMHAQVADTWYVPFFQRITERCHIDELADRFSKITLIVFNYDRCVEHFLYDKIQTTYRTDPEHAAELVSHLKIFHPYGQVGQLHWQPSERDSVPFGSSTNNGYELTMNLKTFTEGTDASDSKIVELRKSVRETTKVVFLRFGFHAQNMEALFPTSIENPTDVHCFASAYKMSEYNQNAIRELLFEKYKTGGAFVQIVNKSCRDLFEEYSMGLTFN